MPAITAIIATWNELPQNLERTVDGLRGHGVRVAVVEDGPVRLGCGYRRNQGILSASTELVFLCDAHMDFEPGFFNALASELAAQNCRFLGGRGGLAVLKEYWGLGVGVALIDTVAQAAQARGVQLLELEVIQGNVRAQRLYERMGFRTVGEHPNAIRLKDGTLLTENLMAMDLTVKPER